MNEVRYLRQPAERRRCPPIGGHLSLPYFSSARLASPFAEIGRNPCRDRSTSASRSVATRVEIGPVPQVCCVLMVPRCGMRLSPSSSPCAPRRRAGQAEPDRSRTGTGPISTRVATDFEPEPDRSRHGLRPISARLGARGWVWQGSCVNLVGGQSGTGQAPAPAILRAGREMSVCRAAVRQASTITSMTAGRGRSLRVTISTRRCSWASGRTSTAG